MRVKLDENIPASAVGVLGISGHDVDTVAAEGLTAAADDLVVEAASATGRLLITMDRGIGDLRRHPPGSHAGVIVLRLRDQSAPAVLRVIEQLTTADLNDLAGCITVVQPGLIRSFE